MDIVEVWKDIPHYDGLYQVSNLGNVWSVRRQRKLKPSVLPSGYCVVHLTNKYGKHKNEYLHRLVALAHIPNPNHLPQVNHRDENKLNNCVANLEWCDNKYNNNYGTKIERQRAQISKPVVKIDGNTNQIIDTYSSVTEAHQTTGHARSMISHQCHGNNDSRQNYYFKFLED